VITSSITDAPWSQYYCCVLAANTEFVHKYPIATKRALRAILKAVDFYASDPRRVAQLMVDGGFAARYDYAMQALTEIRFDVGGNTTPRTRSVSMHCGCTRWA
jgi:NitT/TauT family transport system substrate-binding protein